MRQPSPAGVSVKAKRPPLEPEISECVLSFAPPMVALLPFHQASKFAWPEPRSPGCVGSPLPVPPCSRLPHSVAAFQIASSAPVKPGQSGSGAVLLLACAPLKLSQTRTARCARESD